MVTKTKKNQYVQTNLLDLVEFYRLDANRKIDPVKRSNLGQFMTCSPVAEFMASLFHSISDDIYLLDAGAAVGSLTAAFIQEAYNRKIKPSVINSICYEIDELLIKYLHETLKECKRYCKLNEIEFNYEILNEDFIASSCQIIKPSLFKHKKLLSFTHAILNPPYMKILSSSSHRHILSQIGIETSNLYTGFLAMAIKLLKPGGEIVAIVPRSFCNGTYFINFRKFLFSEVSIKHIHVFESRTKAFKEDEVLQENIIFHAVKGGKEGNVHISSSEGPDFVDMTRRIVSYDKIIKPNDPNKLIYIATSELDQSIVDRISLFKHTLNDLDVEVSTGPVVDFRVRDFLLKEYTSNCAPLLYPHHFEKFKLVWPKNTKKPNAIQIHSKTKKWLFVNSGYYPITKRFTSKEEKKRIVANIYDSSLPGELIGFENHLNVFHKSRGGISNNLALGLAIYLNSALVDNYFRLFSGHTQVNSSDLEALPYPSTETLKRFASKIKNIPDQKEIDSLINEEIGSMANQASIDPIKAKQKIEESLEILKSLGLPKGQQNERSAITLLTILNLKPEGSWQKIEKPLIGVTPIMDWCRKFYGKDYAPNTRETFRRQTIHQFVEAGIALYNPDKLDRPVNSPKACYQISPEVFEVIVTYGTKKWDLALTSYLKNQKTLVQQYAMERKMKMIPVIIDKDHKIELTPGEHSKLIKEIIIEFAPRYAPGSEVIYIGDTGDKIAYFKKDKLTELGVEVDRHGKMPDVVFYYPEKNWILLIEAVTSHGPINSKRHNELSKLFAKAKTGLVYVTAFQDRATMARYLAEISWETEVWVAEAPTHLIHFNGVRFVGPYDNKE